MPEGYHEEHLVTFNIGSRKEQILAGAPADLTAEEA
jgi:hypothetical protein